MKAKDKVYLMWAAPAGLLVSGSWIAIFCGQPVLQLTMLACSIPFQVKVHKLNDY